MVIAAGVNHQGVALDLGNLLQTRCQHRIVGDPVSHHIYRWQITQMPVGVRAEMLAGFRRIEMPASGQRCALDAIFGARFAAAVFMDMEAVDAGRQRFQVRGEQQAVRRLADSDRADRLRRAVGADQVDCDFLRCCLCGADCQRAEQTKPQCAFHKRFLQLHECSKRWIDSLPGLTGDEGIIQRRCNV